MTVWLVVQRLDWTYAINARAVANALADRFDFRIVCKPDEVKAGPGDVVVDFWWNGQARHERLIRQVSSHRWSHAQYGRLTAADLADRCLADARVVIVPSMRLKRELAGLVDVMRTPKGFDPDAFHDRGERSGDLVVGWVGRVKPDKGIRILRQAEADLRIACSLPYEQMPDFYAGIDVIACASVAEGDPRPLIEGMACGCFPVVVDVGIVPELVRHGVNGLIVERSEQAFRDAFAWCRANLEYVRVAGAENARRMATSRTWAHVAPAWAAAIAAA